MGKLVSIVILNWNGKQHLRNCLDSIKAQSYSPLEVIVVDNGSSDGSQMMVRREFSWVKLVLSKTNRGYSGGNNLGISKSKGEYVFVLNNDTQVDKNFLKPLLAIMESDKNIGCVQPKMLYSSNHDLLNAVGSYFTSTGILYHYGYRKNAKLEQYNKRLKIFSAKGAAMLLRKSALSKIGLFDEDFFIYFEETDLCHRLWLSGYQVIYEPKSVIYHNEAVDTGAQFSNYRVTYLSFRNRISSYIKNLEIINIIKVFSVMLPLYLFMFILHIILLRFTFSMGLVVALLWNVIKLPQTLVKRRYIQSKLRTKTDRELFRIIKRDPEPIYYYYLFTTLKNYTNEPAI
ncbi:MAG: glycosyltransferase [bacterium]|nr:glycosyltransferase [bacterium]